MKIGDFSYFDEDMEKLNSQKLYERYISSKEYKEYFREDFPYTPDFYSADQGEEIIAQDEENDSLYYLCSGRCKVSFLMPNGKSAIVNTLKAPCLIGEIELFDLSRSLSVSALEDCRLFRFRKSEVKETLLKDPYFLRKLCADLVKKERDNIYKLTHTYTYPLKNRLAKFLLDYREGDLFRIWKVTVSESLGVSYRHLETVMAAFVEEGILEKKKTVYRLVDIKKLEELSSELVR